MIRDLDAILATATECELARELLGQIRRARDQLLTFCDFPGKVYTRVAIRTVKAVVSPLDRLAMFPTTQAAPPG